MRAASQLPGKGPLMWMMPLHLHVNQKSDFDMMIYYLILITVRLPGIFVLKVTLKTWKKNQERALRFVYDDFKSTYEELLNKANIPFLHIKKIRTMAVETFRILNDMSPLHCLIWLGLETVLLITLAIKMFCRCRKFAQQNTVRKVSDLQLPSCGTAFQIILDK